VNRRGLGSEYTLDIEAIGRTGRWHHTFSQSLLNTYLQCPEQARHELLGDVPRVESPKMALGTAGHSAIEHKLLHPSADFEECAELMLDTFENRMYLTEFKEDPKLGMDWARKRGVSALNSWWEEILPQVQPEAVELPFQYRLYSDDKRTIDMKGTIDCVDRKDFIWDWKFSGSERKEWKDRRGSVQATAYTRAAGVNHFKYAVMHEQGVQIVPLNITAHHFAWLQYQAVTLATLIEAELPVWPLDDTDWWCDPKWCSVFAAGQCKGQFFPERIGR